MNTLEGDGWRRAASEHAARVDAELGDVVARRVRGLKHPVDDFLFQYYNLRPSQLRSWHPGIGVGLRDAGGFADRPFHTIRNDVVLFDAGEFIARRGSTVDTAHRLLAATHDRTPRFGCFGMHEWAMVYRMTPEQLRHTALPLRLGHERSNEVVESHTIGCTHFDAFRFFTPEAVPLNKLKPTRETQADFEQPGCLHANMDLYKWA